MRVKVLQAMAQVFFGCFDKSIYSFEGNCSKKGWIMSKNMKLISLVCLSLALGIIINCGSSYRINYSNVKADLNYSGTRSVAVGVLDKRPYVISGENDPRFVGTMRGGYGNPFDLWTTSDLRLSDEMASNMAESLRGRGFKVVSTKAVVGKDASGMLAEMKSTGAQRLVLMVMNDWWSNYYPRSFGAEKSELIIDVELKVMDNSRKTLGSKKMKEIVNVESGWPQDTIPGWYKKKMTELLNDKSIQRALK